MSAIGRLLGRQMGDVFGEYVLKSRETVEGSPRGRTKPKPAASYIKEMQKEGVPTEEMKDLGLLDDYDPKTGLDRQKLMTKEEMLSEIDRRRAERLESRGVYRGDIPPPIGEGETVNPRFVGGKKIIKKSPPPQFESPEPVIGTQSKQRTPMTSYNIYQQDIGDPYTYEEITYGLREGPEGKRAARRTGELSDRSVIGFYSRSEDEMGLHFPERDQLFHLRLNRGKTTDGEGVTNLLELQSDIQQRAQKGTPLELKEEEATPLRPTKPEYRDPTLPMVHNWEVLGVKEAVRRAVQNGDRYLAITPGREIGRAVGAVEAISTEEPLKAILTRSQSGKIDIIFTGLDIRKEYSDLENIDDLNIVNPKMSPDVEEILSGMGYEEYLNNPMEFSGYLDDIENARFENNLSILARAMVTVQFNDFGYKTLSAEGIQYAEKLVDDFMDSLVDYGIDVGGDVEDFVAEITEDPIQVYSLVLPESIIDRMLTIRSSLEDSEAIADEVLQRMYTDEQVAKALNINIGEVRRLADSGESVEITPEMEFGGEGVIDFYDKVLISEKRLQKYGAPLVEIEQTRPDGTTVTTNALDLKKFIDAKKKNKKAKIPYSLYSAVLGIPLAGKLGSVALSQEQTTNEEPQAMAEGGMLDEGGTVDPVSGNDVPAGSLQEEVRDDIPAQLSEGEFVFPADVVRYIGLDRLMELRQEAKQGLQKMDAMGQMGNSEEAVMSDDVPHEAMEFQQGGMVPASNIPSFYGQQQPAYMQPGAVQTAVRYAGQQQAPTQSVYQPQQFQQVAAIGPQPVPRPVQPVQPTQPTQAPIQQVAPTAKVPYEMKRYRNAEGNVIYIPFMNGVPQFPIPEGYSEQSRMEAITGEEETEPTPTETKVETATVRGDEGGSGRDDQDTSPTGTAKTDPVMGIARGFSELNPNSTVATNVDKYKSAQIKGLAGAALGVFSGNLLGAGVSLYRMNQKMDEYKNAAFEGLPDAVKQQLQVTAGGGYADVAMKQFIPGQKEFITTDQFTDADAQAAFKEAKAAGASDALAAALATSTGAFRGDTSGMDLGGFESSIAKEYGTDVGSAQTAMIGQQLEGFTQEELDDFYGQEAPSRGRSFTESSRLGGYDDPSYADIEAADAPVDRVGDAAAREEEGGPMGRVDRGGSLRDSVNRAGESVSRSTTRGGTEVTTTTDTTTGRSSSFIDSDGDGEKDSNEKGVVTDRDGDPVTNTEGEAVTSRSDDDRGSGRDDDGPGSDPSDDGPSDSFGGDRGSDGWGE